MKMNVRRNSNLPIVQNSLPQVSCNEVFANYSCSAQSLIDTEFEKSYITKSDDMKYVPNPIDAIVFVIHKNFSLSNSHSQTRGTAP